jgi:hypothetical protein
MTATALETEMTQTGTLSQRLAEGPISLPEALRYATMLAEALRQIHDTGRTFGALMPSSIVLAGSGLELIAPREPAGITPYTAPEILQGRTADSRTDIFAFGAIVYEMITGRRAFAGDNGDALAVSLTISVPPSTGIPAADHLIANCVAKDPAVRCPRMQKAILELKLLTFGTLRAEAPVRQQVVTATLRAETQQLEVRMAGLIEAHEKAIAEMRQATDSALNLLREQVATLQSELAAAQERAARAEQEHGDHYQNLVAHVERVEGNVQAIDQRIVSGEGKVEVLSQGVNVLQEYEATRMQEFEQALRAQSAEIALVSASQVQTDDLVEGVVAAMELLQSSVFDYAEK